MKEVAKAAAVDPTTVSRIEKRNRSAEENAEAERQAEEAERGTAERRRRVAELVAEGKSVRKIAAELDSKPTTIQDDKAWLAAQADKIAALHLPELPEVSFPERIRKATGVPQARGIRADHEQAIRNLAAVDTDGEVLEDALFEEGWDEVPV